MSAPREAAWIGPLLAAALAGCGQMPKGIIEKQRESDAANAAAAARAAEAAQAAARAGTEPFNVVAIEAEANRIFQESNARIEAQRAEGEAMLTGDGKPQADKPVEGE